MNTVASTTAGLIHDLGDYRTEPMSLTSHAYREGIPTTPAGLDLCAQGQAPMSFTYPDEALHGDLGQWWRFEQTLYYPYLNVDLLDGGEGVIV